MRRVGIVSLLLLTAAPGLARADPAAVLQPTESRRRTVLIEADAGTQVRSAGGRSERIRLRQGESLDSLVEVAAGWVAAGTRESEGARSLVVIAGGAGVQRRLSEPPSQQARHRVRPALLADFRGVEGMAWLEGDGPRALGVQAARWTDEGWGPPETVAAPGTGSQSGLTATRLQDGRWLLAWSGFDGKDDEILWSLRDGAGWTPPRRVGADNRVPDILPSLLPVPGGALLAWNRFDGGEYRVMTARLEGDRWRDLRAAGPLGSVRPQLLRRQGRLLLLYRDLGLPGWALLQLDRQAREIGRASFPTREPAAPAVLEASARSLRVLKPASGREQSVPWEDGR